MSTDNRTAEQLRARLAEYEERIDNLRELRQNAPQSTGYLAEYSTALDEQHRRRIAELQVERDAVERVLFDAELNERLSVVYGATTFKATRRIFGRASMHDRGAIEVGQLVEFRSSTGGRAFIRNAGPGSTPQTNGPAFVMFSDWRSVRAFVEAFGLVGVVE